MSATVRGIEQPITRQEPHQHDRRHSAAQSAKRARIKGGPWHFAIKGSNAQAGTLTTMWDDDRPSGYNPMNKEDAIVLGIGGDNSNSAAGTFFEGAMTWGYPSDATENAVQANIVAAGYGR
jgi:hypothetical protein